MPPKQTATEDWPRPAVTVDLAIFTVMDTDLKILLIERGVPPFLGEWALPGGFVHVERDGTGESVEEAAYRELSEETGLQASSMFLEQLYTFGKPNRDPRTRVISVAWYALIRPDLAPIVTAGSDANDARWWSVQHLPKLAFDHEAILRKAIDRLRREIEAAPIAFSLVPETFTIAELRSVFEAVHGHRYDRGNFRRRFNRMCEDGLIVQAPGKRQTNTRPAKVYRFVS